MSRRDKQPSKTGMFEKAGRRAAGLLSSCGWRRVGAFACCWLVVGEVWLVVLPAVARRPEIRARIDEQTSRGIDPSALFYTDLEAMSGVRSRLDDFHRRRPQALWVPAPTE